MSKGPGTTKSVGSGSASAGRTTGATLGGGSGVSESNSFSSNAKMSQFEGSASLDGGYYSLMTKDGKYSMVIETENGFSNEYGVPGTMVTVGISKGTGPVERLTGFYVEGGTYTESMGSTYYDNGKVVADKINKQMPYLAELANNWIKKNQ